MRQVVGLLLGLLLMAYAVQPLQAGGWASVTIDGWPDQWVTGQQYTLGITIRQHGRQAVAVREPVKIVARHSASGETVEVTAAQVEGEATYRADMILPKDGAWRFTVMPGWFPETVVSTQVVAAQPLATAVRWWMALPFAAAAAAVAVVRLYTRWGIGAAGGMAALALIALVGLRAEESQSADLARYGRELFAVKGCTACHRHAGSETQWSTEMGPSLTRYEPDEEWLKRWLADPAALRPATLMPDLELAPHEIDALIAFLSEDRLQ